MAGATLQLTRTEPSVARRFPPPWSVEEQSACFVVFLLDPLMNVDPLHKK
jgi:hypothetical protein